MKTPYRGFLIDYDPKPVPSRSVDYDYWNPDNEEQCGSVPSVEAAKEEIDELLGDGAMHSFQLILSDSQLEQVYRRYSELDQMPVNGQVVEQIERDIGAIACAAIKIDLRIAAKIFELELLLDIRRGAK